MTADPRGRWFRVYARQVRQHAKFRDLSVVELGAWTALRSEAELRDGATFADRADALLVLRRRRTPKAGAVLGRMLELRLFDECADGSIVVHDRADHDRKEYPSDAPDQVAERQRKSRASKTSHEDVTTRDGDGHDTPARGEPAEAAPASSLQPEEAATEPGGWLADDQDSVSVACRMLLDGGRWLGDKDYVHDFEELDRRYTSEWVQAEIHPAYKDVLHSRGKVLAWDLKRMIELRLAERSRREELETEKAERERIHAEREAQIRRIEEATPEQRERAAYQQAAIRLALKFGVQVPTEADEVRAFVEEHGGLRTADRKGAA